MEISGKEVKSKEQNHSVKGNPSQRALPLGPAPSLSRETLTTESWGGGGSALHTLCSRAEQDPQICESLRIFRGQVGLLVTASPGGTLPFPPTNVDGLAVLWCGTGTRNPPLAVKLPPSPPRRCSVAFEGSPCCCSSSHATTGLPNGRKRPPGAPF